MPADPVHLGLMRGRQPMRCAGVVNGLCTLKAALRFSLRVFPTAVSDVGSPAADASPATAHSGMVCGVLLRLGLHALGVSLK